jgi:type IV pilus assembly protein PilQ
MKNNFVNSVYFMIFLFLLLIPRLNAETDLSNLVDSDKTISMDLQDANLKDVLKIFSIQSGLNFIASEAVKDRKITLYLDKVPIKEAMTQLFKANKLNYDYDELANIFTVNYADDSLEPDMVTRIYRLKYRSVSSANLEKEKASLFTGPSVTSGQLSASGGPSGGSTAGGSGANFLDAIKQILSKKGKVTEDSRTNSVIITDLAGRFPMIEEIIRRLDIPQPQVMLDVEMLDVSKDAVDKLGFNIGSPSSPSPFTMILGGSMSRSSVFIGPGDSNNNLVNRGATITTPGVAGSLVLGNTLSMVLDFLNQQTDTRYLARPRILTLNNETAEIGITRDEIVSSQLTTQTTNGGPTITSNNYQRATSLSLTPEGIGIFLRVTPQINMDTGEINLVINPKTSSTTQSPSVPSSVQIARDPEVRSTKSIIKVFDGETVVLGGLIHQEKTQTNVKVPIFGDIPILGIMFRHKDVEKNLDRELLVFITPHIIKERDQKRGQGSKPSSEYPDQYPALSAERGKAIANMLNDFEKERNDNAQRKVSQAGGAVN